MDQYLTVNVVTPDGLVYDHHAAIVVARTTAGNLVFYLNMRRSLFH